MNMIKPTMKIIKEVKSEAQAIKNIEELRKLDVLVGVPQDKSSRKEDKTITNAELLFIHTNGSPLRNIPARPVIEPAIQEPETKERIVDWLKKAIMAALNGNMPNAIEALNKAGMIGQNAARRWFVNPKNNWPPNSPATIKAKGSDRPLIDTGELRKSIIYVIRKK